MTQPLREGLTRAELLALPAVVDVPTAARALRLGRSTAYELARRGEFPCPVLRVGGSYRIPTSDLLRVLGIDPASEHGSASRSAALLLAPKGATSGEGTNPQDRIEGRDDQVPPRRGYRPR